MLIKILHWGRPSHPLPLLWALAVQMRAAAEVVLQKPKFAHLASMFSDQHGHAIDDINKHIVLKKDCGNAVADFELLFLVNAEGTGENENGIGQHDCADKRAKRNRCAGNLHRAQTDCLHHREFTVV